MNKLETNYQGIPIPVDSTAGGIKSLLSGTVNPVSWLPSLLGFLAGPSRFIRGPLNSPYPHLGTYQPDSDGTETAPPSVQQDWSDFLEQNPELIAAYSGGNSLYSGANSFNPVDAVTDYGRDVLDTVVGILTADSTGKGVILGPGGVTGNVIFGGGVGPIPGADPAIYTGTYGGVDTGVTTGIPAVDAAIKKVIGQTVGGETTTADVIIETVAEATGIPIGEAIDILKDAGVLTPTPTPTTTTPTPTTTTTTPTPTPTTTTPTPTTTTPTPTDTTVSNDQKGGTTVGVSNEPSLYDKILDWLKKDKDATDEEIRTAAENAKVTPEDIAKATGVPVADVQERWDNAGKDVVDQVRDATQPTPTPITPTPTTPTPTPTTPTPTTPTPTVVEPTPTPIDVTPTPTTPTPIDKTPTPIKPTPTPIEPTPTPITPTPIEPTPTPIDPIVDPTPTPPPIDTPTPTPIEPTPTPITPTPITPCPDGQDRNSAGVCVGPTTTTIDVTPTPTTTTTTTTTPRVPSYEQGYQTVTTEPGDLALIKYLYDIGGESIFAPQMAEEDNPSLYTTYASGGKVAEFDIVEEALRLLRGD